MFTRIKKNNYWGSDESVSGGGSTLVQTQKLIVELSKLLQNKEIKSMIDIPCGDFNWMQKVNLDNIRYTGADIVDELICENIQKYEANNIKFQVLDIIRDPIPANDLIFIRDCFVHLSYNDIFKAIANIKKSGCKYLLTTTFTDRHSNYDIITGEWRPLNFQNKPFLFPTPEHILIEDCTEGDGEFIDKSMGLWRIERI